MFLSHERGRFELEGEMNRRWGIKYFSLLFSVCVFPRSVLTSVSFTLASFFLLVGFFILFFLFFSSFSFFL